LNLGRHILPVQGVSYQETCHIMAMNTYNVVPDGNGKWQVTATGPSGRVDHVIADFASEIAAQSWTDYRRMIEASASRLCANDRPV
jgi:hypothetical protein